MLDYKINLQLFADDSVVGDVAPAGNTSAPEGGENTQTAETEPTQETLPEPQFDYGLDKDGNLVDLTGDYDQQELAPNLADVAQKQEQNQQTLPAPLEQQVDIQPQQEPTYKVNIGGQEYDVPASQMQQAYLQQMQQQALLEQQRQAQAQQTQQQNKFAQIVSQAQQKAIELLQAQGVDVAELDDWDPVHQAAKQYAMNQIIAEQTQQNFVRQQRKMQIDQMIAAEKAIEPNFDTINEFSVEYLNHLPFGQAQSLYQRIQSGDVNAACQLYNMAKQEYYRRQNNIPSSQNQQVQQKIEPIKVEGASGGDNPTVAKPLDYSKLGSMTTDQQAAFLIKAGLV